MGLTDILTNPGILGLAMAGLSRNPNAPMQAYNVYESANQMARQDRLLEEAKKEKELQRADNVKFLQAMYGQQQAGNPLVNALMRYKGAQEMPETVTQGFTPDNQTGTATDLETGQSYTPNTAVNNDRVKETVAALKTIQGVANPAQAAIDFTKFPNADPNLFIKYAEGKLGMQQEAAKWLIEEAKAMREKEWKREEIGLKGKEDRETAKFKAGLKEEAQETVPMIVGGKQVNVPVGQALNAEIRQQMMEESRQRHEENMTLRKELADRAMAIRERVPAHVAKDVSDKLGTLDRYRNLVDGFSDKYAGSKILGPQMSSVYEKLGVEKEKPRVNWWKEFRWLDNQLRHEIFGASLTKNEQSAWDRTTINENSDPAIVKQQLEQRLNYAQNALNRGLDSYTSAGYNMENFKKPEVQENKMKQGGGKQPIAQPAQPTGKPKTWEELKGKYGK